MKESKELDYTIYIFKMAAELKNNIKNHQIAWAKKSLDEIKKSTIELEKILTKME